MRTGKLMLAAVAASLLLAFAAGTATASRSIGQNQTGLITGTSPEIVFTDEESGQLRCAVTLIGSLHARIAKAIGTLAGFLTEGRAERCRTNLGTGGGATVLAERGERRVVGAEPWHVTYRSFTGTLPNIATVSVQVVRGSFLLEIRGIFGEALALCLYQGDIGAIGTGLRVNEISRLEIDPTRAGARLFRAVRETGRRCLANGTLSGTPFTVRPALTLTLA